MDRATPINTTGGDTMQIACLGGGPAGLYFAISAKLRSPDWDITVYERNRSDDTFGWGVVLSDETLDNLAANDAPSADAVREKFAYWDDVALHIGGTRNLSTGHGFCGIGRKALLIILQDRARELGVNLAFQTDVDDIDALRDRYDLVVAADGLNSRTRTAYADQFRPEIDMRQCHFVWLGTRQRFADAFTFIFEQTDHGWVWAHAYQFDDNTATFIVECSPQTYQAFGFDKMSQEDSIKTCERIFAAHLGGHGLMSNSGHIRGSAWIQFPRVLCQQWFDGNVVLLGDASATAHFSIGSGTKLALESAIALADCLQGLSASDAGDGENLRAAFTQYQDARQIEVLRLQSAARNSMEWFEQVERYLHLDPTQLTYALLTRSQRISHENLRLRDPDWLRTAEQWFQHRAMDQCQPEGDVTQNTPQNTPSNMPSSTGSDAISRTAVDSPKDYQTDMPVRPPMFAPFRLRNMILNNRIVVSPMAQYKATDGTPTDWHLVHYGERAKGGAGLVVTEMTCVSADGRITPGCTGLYAPEHEQAWQRITDFVHRESSAKICCQIGHAGRKGSTQIGWQAADHPLPDGNWPLIAPSAIAWGKDNAVPHAMTRDDMDRIRDQFVAATQMADRCGFDMIELHGAHGYLLSSFLSPVSNIRDDDYGGDLMGRLRYPLEVFMAMRAVWPTDKPMSVRISAHDWLGEKGNTADDAVEIARAFNAAGADLIDVSAGQTSPDAQPVYGRMFQTPFADRIKNDLDVATMAVGNIYEADHANSILLAGRADLVAIARPHLADPYWTLHQATQLNDRLATWPLPYLAGRDQEWRLADRAKGDVKP
jgi:anthraniloyl-CoA monooxygenase